MASSTNDDDNTIVNYHDIYVQQVRNRVESGEEEETVDKGQLLCPLSLVKRSTTRVERSIEIDLLGVACHTNSFNENSRLLLLDLERQLPSRNVMVRFFSSDLLFQTNNTAGGSPADLARIDQMMSTNPRHHHQPPPSYNQLPATPAAAASATPSSSTTRVLTGNDVIIITAGNNTLVTVGQSAGGSSSRHHNRGEPPSYEEAINPDAPPPSYDSLFGRVREAHKSSTGMLDFLKNVVILLLGTREYWMRWAGNFAKYFLRTGALQFNPAKLKFLWVELILQSLQKCDAREMNGRSRRVDKLAFIYVDGKMMANLFYNVNVSSMV